MGYCCRPLISEFQKRAKEINSSIVKGEKYPVQDLTMYILNSEASKMGRRKYLKKPDLQDIVERLKTMYPVHAGSHLFVRSVNHLPGQMQEMMELHPCWKVEWFWQGEYKAECSGIYEDRYRPFDMSSVHGRIADTINFCNWDKGYMLWQESLFRPGVEVFYEGKAFWHLDKEGPVVQKATMLTCVYDMDHVVTLTVVSVSSS